MLTEKKIQCIIFLVPHKGAWCNGNTWVSKTFVEGSSPSAPAKRRKNASFFMSFAFLTDFLPFHSAYPIMH